MTTPEKSVEEIVEELHMKLVPYLNHPEEFQRIIKETLQAERQKREEAFWEGFKLSAEGYNYEYWGQGSIEELEKDIKAKALTQPNNK